MSAVACNKCGEALHIDQGSPSGLKVVKCPACNYPNLFTLPLKNQGQPSAPGRAPSQGDAAQRSAGDAVELGPPGSSLDLPAPKKSIPPIGPATGGRSPLLGRGRGVDLPTPAKTPRPSTTRPSDPALPAPVGRTGQPRPGSSATDLPAPVSGRSPRGPAGLDLPAPRRAPTDTGAPAAKRAATENLDLPAPRGPARLSRSARDQVDLPAPSRPSTQDKGPEIIDLPVPSGAGEDDDMDLLAPAGPGATDLPEPAAAPTAQAGSPLDDDPFGLGDSLGADNPLDAGGALGDDNPLGDPLGGGNPLGNPLNAGNPLDAGGSFGDDNPLGDPLGTGNPLDAGGALGGGNPLDAGGALDGDNPLGDPFGDDNPLGDPLGQPAAASTPAGDASSDFFGDIGAPGNLLDQGGSSDDFFGGLGLGSDASAEDAKAPADAGRGQQAEASLGGEDPDPLGLQMPEGATAEPLALADPDEFRNSEAPTASFDMNALDLGSGDGDDSAAPVALSLADRSEPVAAPGVAAKKDAPKGAAPFDSMDIGLPDLPGSPSAKPAGAAAKAASAASSGDMEDFGGLDLPSIPAPPPRAKDLNKEKAESSKSATEAKPRSLRSRAQRMAKAKEEEEAAPALTLEKDAIPQLQIQQGYTASDITRRHEARRRARRKRRILLGVAVVLVVGAGAGGFVAYTRLQQKQEQQATITAGLQEALAHLRSGKPDHWERAGEVAQGLLAVDPAHPEILGIAAEASFAALLDEGTRADERRATGAGFIEQIDKNVAKGLHVDKAQALKSIDQVRPEPAIERLERVLERQPGDPDALLYLGWAHAAASDFGRAAELFEKALKKTSERKLPALYGLAQARLATGDHAGALEAFEAILSQRADHIGALIGKAKVVEVKQPGDREALYLNILKRKDLDRADPRAVSHAWELAGYQALNGGRIEEAKRRFGHAVERNPGNVPALIGQAKVALLQERFEDARTALTTVLRADPEHIEASLTFADLSLRTDKPEDARQYADKIIAREDTLEDKGNLVRAYIVRGKTLEADESKTEETIAAFERARELAGNEAIEPAVALAKVLTRTGRTEEARAVLSPIHDKAGNDSSMANTLGIIYSEAGALSEAEEWFRKALELQPDDMDAQLQLGKVLTAQKRNEEAISTLQAAFESDPSRVDIGVTLADLLEQLGRTEQADSTYAALLEAGTPGVSVLARAGLFYARIGKPERAGELGEQILSQQERHAAGLFLRGEGQYHRGEHREALHSYRDAVGIDPDPRHLEAQGRASEKLNLHKEAMDAYTKAAEIDPSYLAPRLGQANLLIERREFQKALELLGNARKLDATDPMVHFYTGVCYQAQGNDKKAVEALRISLQYDSRHAEAHYRIGRSYFELSKLNEAASALGRATALATGEEPWLVRAYLDLGYVQRSRSKRREAIHAWEKYLEHLPEKNASGAEAREVRRLLMGLREQSR